MNPSNAASPNQPEPKADSRSLFVVVFEVKPNEERGDEYLSIAGGLRPRLVTMPGFLENERFRSRSRPGWLLSLSLWDDEKALVRWRTVEKHHDAQSEGRQGVLDDYHIRVGEVTVVSGSFGDRRVGWMRHDTTQVSECPALTIIDTRDTADSALPDHCPGTPNAVGHEVFDHISTHGRVAIVNAWSTQEEADVFAVAARGLLGTGAGIYAVRVFRDYSLDDRREAPQFYPPR
jgi:heme-degrading monooxygenase HmoA